jgi:hypothetical protein
MSRHDLAEKLSHSGPRTHALIYELAIQDDDECYHELKRKRQIFKGYSHKAFDRLRGWMKTLNLDEVWQRQKHRFGAGARKKERALRKSTPRSGSYSWAPGGVGKTTVQRRV